MTINLKHSLLAGCLTLVAAAGVRAETYRFSSWSPDQEGTVQASILFAKDLAEATNGDITFEMFSGGVLMPPKAHLQGIGDGVVHAGQITAAYTPAEVPRINALLGYGFVEPDPVVISAAFADWVMHDPAGQEELRASNVLPLAAYATPTYQLICNTAEPITELEQIKGLKVRSFGLIGALLRDLGAVPVNIPAGEAYQAMQTRQIDCAALGADFLMEKNMAEVSSSTTMTNWSPAFNPQFNLNVDFWRSLTDEQRAMIIQHSARAHARVAGIYHDAAVKSLEDAQAQGHAVVQPGETLTKAVNDWVAAGVGDMAGIAKDTYGVEDPQALFASFDVYLEKWRNLIGAMEDPLDEDALMQVFLDNMYNDLDPATYGM